MLILSHINFCPQKFGLQHNSIVKIYNTIVVFWPFDPGKNAIQGDAPEGSDTF